MRADGLVIEELDTPSLTDAQIDELNVFVNAMRAEAMPEDPPFPDELARTEARAVPAFVVLRQFVWRDGDGAIVGRLFTVWERAEHNQHLMRAKPEVLRTHRRRGIGSSMLAKAVECADDAGKTLLVSDTVDRVSAGESFAERIGARRGMVGHTNRLAIADVDRAMVERWVEEGPVRAPGYSLVAVDGPCPDDLIERVVDVMHVMNTAPTEDLEVEDQTWTVEEMRAMEKSQFALGGERRYLAARDDSTGELVGFTEMWRYPKSEPHTVRQWGTAVRPEHRGHALGKWLKATNILRLLDEWPDVVDVRTHNADSNDPMLGINHALGFKPYTVDINWQIAVEELRTYVEGR